MGERAGSGRMVVGSIGAGIIALVLNLPWVLGVLPSAAPSWTRLGVPPREAAHHGLGALAAFDFGPHRLSGLALGLTMPLIAALAIARSYRFAWAGRAAFLAAGGLGTAWLIDRGTIPASPSLIPVFLAPYAVALAGGRGVLRGRLRPGRPRDARWDGANRSGSSLSSPRWSG